MLRFLSPALALACAPDPKGPSCPLDGPHLLLATTDYEAGALAALDPATGCLDDLIASASADALVRWLPGAGRVAVADRAGGDAVRLYEPGDYTSPAAEFAVDRGGNVHDIAEVDGELWLALYERDELVRTDPSGAELGRLDLSAWADDDGLPEADRLIRTEAGLFAGLQRLHRAGPVWQPGEGRIVRIDTERLRPSDDGLPSPGPNPKLAPDPTDPRRLLALTGIYGAADGALVSLDPDAGERTEPATEGALGFDLSAVAGVGGRLVLIGTGFEIGDGARLVCFDPASGAVTGEERADAWFVDAVAGDDRVYVAVRTSFAGDPADAVLAVDPETCAVETLAEGFALDPYAMAWVSR